MKNYILKTNDFTLEFELKVFDKDVNIPTNFILNIKINSDNFGAITTMDIDIKMFQKFAKELFDVYTTLSYQIVDTVVGKMVFSSYKPPRSITMLFSFNFWYI